MTGAGFIHTAAATDAGWRSRAMCTQFPTTWADRMWLYEDAADDASPDRTMRAAARKVCAECPVRAQCLASATVEGEQYGIRGGLRLRERKLAAELAEQDGVTVYSRSGAHQHERFVLYLKWLLAHEEVWDQVVQMDRDTVRRCKRRKNAELARAEKARTKKHARRPKIVELVEESPAMQLQDALF